MFDWKTDRIVQRFPLPSRVIAAAHDAGRTVTYLALANGTLHAVTKSTRKKGQFAMIQVAQKFGPTNRGFFVLPGSGRVLGVAANGVLTVYDPGSQGVTRTSGPVPLPAGSAVDPREDVWYYADKKVVSYSFQRAYSHS